MLKNKTKITDVLLRTGNRQPGTDKPPKIRRLKQFPASCYCVNSAGRPVNRSMRLAIGGWVENKLPKFIPNRGWTMNK